MPIDFQNEAKFTYPGVYHIRVSGKVRIDLMDYFRGLEKREVKEQKSGQHETSLIIQVRDQAELIGLINMLYNWQHVILSVSLEEKFITKIM